MAADPSPMTAWGAIVVVTAIAGCSGTTATRTRRTVDVSTGGADARADGSSSGAGGAGIEAGTVGATCTRQDPPATCTRDTWCAPDWDTATQWFSPCVSGNREPYLAKCGAYYALVVPGRDTVGFDFYDGSGALVGSEQHGDPQNSFCVSYVEAFTPPDVASCSPLSRICPPDAGGGPCPSTAGPTMVRIPDPDGTTYCIDSTEVTNRHYFEFLSAKGSGVDGGTDTSGQDPWCWWNTDYDPLTVSFCQGFYDPYARADRPVTCIDWCDASAYCKWAGKHLCGKIGGGMNGLADGNDATKSQWFNACSKGGTLAYPYGSTYDATACNGLDNGRGDVVAVGSKKTCTGGYAGIFDLSGNVWEWEDSCDGTSGAGDYCRDRGGAFNYAADSLTCETQLGGTRSSVFGLIGFRCCAE